MDRRIPFDRCPRSSTLPEAFLAQGVSLADPDTSWSGLRNSDGVVVIAFRDDDVREAPDGFRCLLWSPGVIPFGASGRVARRERYFHCKHAAESGEALALVTHGRANEIRDDQALIHIDVQLRGGEYWAVWGWMSEGAAAYPVLAARAPIAVRRAARVPVRSPVFA